MNIDKKKWLSMLDDDWLVALFFAASISVLAATVFRVEAIALIEWFESLISNFKSSN